MTGTELAAYIGAAAWVPHVGRWIYDAVVVPDVTIIANKQAEISFTSFGPIFNLSLAISADRRDALLDKIEIHLVHEGGDTHQLSWEGMQENLSQISNQKGERAVVEKQQPAIALKIPTIALVERFVRFQEGPFHNKYQSKYKELEDQLDFMKQKGGEFAEELIAGKEFHSLMEFFKESFWWKSGKYTVEFSVASPKRVKLQPLRFEFELSSQNIDRLQKNLENVNAFASEVIRSVEDSDHKFAEIDWSWQNVNMKRVQD